MKYLIILSVQLCFVTSVIAQQVVIDSVIGTLRDAIQIIYAQDDGIYVFDAGDDGVYVASAGDDGVQVNSAEGDGVYISTAGDDGVQVDFAGGDGIVVFGAGGHSLNIQGNKNLGGGIGTSGHIAQIYNRNTGTSPDVLALKVGRTATLGGGINFITFYDGSNNGRGRIEGNSSGGVLYGTSGSDFAECLSPLSKEEDIKAGDIVGVYGGKVSLHTHDATSVMVITDRPAVLGNQKEEDSGDERVSFIGQVFVNVRGSVNAGDWIVASGLEDGTGVAVSNAEITLNHQIVGRAWESNPDPGIKKINAAVGLDNSAAKDAIIRDMKEKLKSQKEINRNLQAQIDQLKRLIEADRG